jgi:hypothetical protein
LRGEGREEVEAEWRVGKGLSGEWGEERSEKEGRRRGKPAA